MSKQTSLRNFMFWPFNREKNTISKPSEAIHRKVGYLVASVFNTHTHKLVLLRRYWKHILIAQPWFSLM